MFANKPLPYCIRCMVKVSVIKVSKYFMKFNHSINNYHNYHNYHKTVWRSSSVFARSDWATHRLATMGGHYFSSHAQPTFSSGKFCFRFQCYDDKINIPQGILGTVGKMKVLLNLYDVIGGKALWKHSLFITYRPFS